MNKAHWLTREEQAAWRAFVNVNIVLFETLDRQLTQDSGMPHAYYAILVGLSEAPDRTMRMSDLAASLAYSPSRLSHAVAKLEKAGWVRREQCPTDGRSTFVILNDEGFQALSDAAPGHVASVRANVFDALTAEQVEQFREICERIGAKVAGS